MLLSETGRFQTNVRLCLSMSDYHPESWSPAWTLETLLVPAADCSEALSFQTCQWRACCYCRQCGT